MGRMRVRRGVRRSNEDGGEKLAREEMVRVSVEIWVVSYVCVRGRARHGESKRA